MPGLHVPAVHPSASTASTLERAAAPPAGPLRARPRLPTRAPARRVWGNRALGAARGGLGGVAGPSHAGAGTDLRRRPRPAGPATQRRGLRHVPRPAGAAAATAALVRGCRGRRSTPPSAFVRILGSGRQPATSPGPGAPARPLRRASAHSVPDRPLPSSDAEEGRGAGPGVTRTREPIRAREGPRGCPAPQTLNPPPCGVRGAGHPQPDARSWKRAWLCAGPGEGPGHPPPSGSLRAVRWRRNKRCL